MRKRFAFTALAVMLVWLALMPMAMAAPGDVMKATGKGDARALDLDVLGLVRLTIAAADGTFEMNTEGAGSATTSGRAVALCNLITGGHDPLACTSGSPAASSAPNGTPSADACTVPPLNVAIIDVKVLCAHSDSSVSGATVNGNHTASLASLKIGLTTDISALLKQITDTVEGAVATVDGIAGTPLAGTLSTVLSTVNSTVPVDTVVKTVQDQLAAVLPEITTLAEVKVLPAEVHMDSSKAKTASVHSTSSVVSISLLQSPVFPQGLIQLEVTPSKAEATFNGDTGKANCHAEAAIVRVKVANLLGGGNLIDLPVNVGGGIDLSKLLPLGNDLVGVKLATATPDAVGDTCRAEARGLELNLLKVLNGGIALRVAATNAEIAGAVTPLKLAAGPVCPDPKGCLPLTGGPTQMYMLAGSILAMGAVAAFWMYRRLQRASA